MCIIFVVYKYKFILHTAVSTYKVQLWLNRFEIYRVNQKIFQHKNYDISEMRQIDGNANFKNEFCNCTIG